MSNQVTSIDINSIADRAKELLKDIPKVKVGLAEILTQNIVKIYYVSYDKVDLTRIKYHLEDEFEPLQIYFTCMPISIADKERIFSH